MFTISEYKERAVRAQKLMVEYGLDALMVTGDYSSADNYRYLSGHLPRDFQQNYARPHIMILTADGSAGLVTFESTYEAAKKASWVDNIRNYTQPFKIEPVHELVEELNLQSAKIGCELGIEQNLQMPFAQFMKLQNAFPNAEFADASDLIWELRTIKSEQEVNAIREAARINNKAQATVLGNLKEGMSEVEITSNIVREIIREGANRPPFAQYTSITTEKFRSGGGYSDRLAGPSNNPLEKGDLLFIDTGCIYDEYWAEFCRMAIIGEPTQEQLDTHRITREICQRTVTEFIKPGVTSDEVMRYAIKLYKEYGVDESKFQPYLEYPYKHLGHSIGLTSSEPPLIQLHNDTVIKEGMCLAIEPVIFLNGFTYSSEENIVVTENGAEFLSDVDTGLYVGETKSVLR